MVRENQQDIQVVTVVQKKITNNMVLNNWLDLKNHPYYLLVFDIKEFHLKTKKPIRRTYIVNIYDSFVGQGYIWQKQNAQIQRVIQKIN